MAQERDPELEKLFGRLQKLSPSSSQMESWELAVETEVAQSAVRLLPRRLTHWGQIAAALFTGILIGYISTHHFEKKEISAEPSATIEYVYDKAQ